MEIEINDKKNNLLLNRTEVYFTIHHENQKTPNRDIIKSELADVLNAKKENIVVDSINSSYGIQKTTGYAKVYTSFKNAESIEQKNILKRNKLIKKKETKKEEPKTEKAEPKKEEEVKEVSQEPVEPAKTEDVQETTEKPDQKKEQE